MTESQGGRRKRGGRTTPEVSESEQLLFGGPLRYDMGWNQHRDAFLELGFRAMVTRLPALLGSSCELAWQADRKAVLFVTHDLEEAIALSDRVVIMSAGPAAHIIGDWKVSLPRPRDIAEIKLDRAFHDLYAEIWSKLKEEVVKTYGAAGAAA